MDRQFFTIYDKGRQLDFEGYKLSTSSSYVHGKSRWFVVTLYKTAGGKYIVAGSGKSNVVHKPECGLMKEKGVVTTHANVRSVGCDTCRPNLSGPVVHEIDREWAQVSDDPRAIIERLRLRDGDGVWYLPKTSTTALLQAAELDEGIKKAFYAPQRID